MNACLAEVKNHTHQGKVVNITNEGFRKVVLPYVTRLSTEVRNSNLRIDECDVRVSIIYMNVFGLWMK